MCQFYSGDGCLLPISIGRQKYYDVKKKDFNLSNLISDENKHITPTFSPIWFSMYMKHDRTTGAGIAPQSPPTE
eukprot:snap_masked-scaffold_4-processed-gene-7.51-mRNA-1 protein AED:1.00 eAED:1.00 QI:0/0/0/0/1/1/2/0/73